MSSTWRRRFLLSAAAAALGGSLLRSARAQTAVTLRISSSLPADPNSAHYIWYQRFATNVGAVPGAKIDLQYFPNSQLGKEADVVQQVKIGSIDMMLTGSSIWATVAPELGMLDLGYVFDSYPHLFKALDGGVGERLGRIVQERTRCTVIGWGSHFGSRSVYTKHPVRNLAEVKGVKLRVLPTTAFIDTFKLIGAIPTPIAFNELYTALQTGVVDGFEHDPSTVLSTKLYEVSKYCWLTEHLFPPMVAVIGKRGWDKLAENVRPQILKAAADATAFQRAQAVEHGKQAIEELKRLGIAYHPMVKAEREQVRREMETKLWAAFATQYPATKPLFEAIAASRA
jgi:tripartite ATP-independent transporter DctP family solute receptor